MDRKRFDSKVLLSRQRVIAARITSFHRNPQRVHKTMDSVHGRKHVLIPGTKASCPSTPYKLMNRSFRYRYQITRRGSGTIDTNGPNHSLIMKTLQPSSM
ncbi:hypothetical protein CEXT_760421 [Caerostris extrusa]|uniref:Uncharacterized protein n=1 Tax=Caerostris extrusa TaxID=172846 RepID=A0AAV4NAN2_CAEEX|nr:hypothetical protein CEXT_760421 [Caerostris extrusa]